MKKIQKHSILNSQFDSTYCTGQSERSRSLFVVIFIFFLTVSLQSFSQNTDAFARVSVSPREGVVRQPYKVTISVYSSTWFAKPLQFANLQIDDAFIIPFTRTVSGINYINNKKYATLTFYYLVFPYNTGQMQIPELEINASIPPEGDYKGQPVTIKTKPQNIKIKPVPSSKDEAVWMVAKNVTVKENWSKPLDQLKVGDVVERQITINANGTLPSLILPLKIEKPGFTSIYPKEPELQDTRNNQDVNGVRVEHYSYLFEEEKEITIPEETILWWNPETRKVYKRTLPEKKLNVSANPDLAMMESLKDSLLAMSAPLESVEKGKAFPWMRLAMGLLALLFVGYFSAKFIQYLIQVNKRKRAAYLQSETYYFKQLLNALHHKERKEFIRQLYGWFDITRKPGQNAAIYYFLNSEERLQLENVIHNNSTKLTEKQIKPLKVLLLKLRENVSDPHSLKFKTGQLNPV